MQKQHIVFFAIILFAAPATVEMGTTVTAFAFAGLALLAITGAYTQRGSAFEPVALVSFIYLVAYPLPSLFLLVLQDYSPQWVNIDPQVLESALLWSFRGFILFLGGYFLFEGRRRRRLPPAANEDLRFQRLWFASVAGVGFLALAGSVGTQLFVGGFGSTFLDTGMAHSSLQQFLHTIEEQRYGFFALFLVTRMRWGRTTGLNIIMAVLLLFQLAEIAVVGSKTPILSLVLSGLLSLALVPVKWRWMVGPKQWVLIIVVSLTVSGTFYVVTEYRVLMRQAAEHDTISFTESIDTFIGVVTGLVSTGSASDEKYDLFLQIASRQASVLRLTGVLENTAEEPPYDNAWSAFLIPLYAFIPLEIMPDKPHFYDSGDYARDYFGWTFGGISMTLPGSLYWTWGYAGIVLGMLGLGLMLGAMLARARGDRGGRASTQVIWIALVVWLVIQLSNTGRTFTGIAFGLIRMGAMLWLMSFAVRFLTFGRRLETHIMQRPKNG